MVIQTNRSKAPRPTEGPVVRAFVVFHEGRPQEMVLATVSPNPRAFSLDGAGVRAENDSRAAVVAAARAVARRVQDQARAAGIRVRTLV